MRWEYLRMVSYLLLNSFSLIGIFFLLSVLLGSSLPFLPTFRELLSLLSTGRAVAILI